MSGGFDVARYNDDPGDGERYDVRLKAEAGTLQQAPDLGKLYLRTAGGELASLLRNADQALYRAKRGGRDRVSAWTATGTSGSPNHRGIDCAGSVTSVPATSVAAHRRSEAPHTSAGTRSRLAAPAAAHAALD